MSIPNVPQNLRISGVAPARSHPSGPSGFTWWWSKARLEKLQYVMTKYNDLDKAARVLCCPRHCAEFRWRQMNKGKKV